MGQGVSFDEALEHSIASLTQLMRTCGEYQDLDTARIATDAQRALIKRRRPEQVARMEKAWIAPK